MPDLSIEALNAKALSEVKKAFEKRLAAAQANNEQKLDGLVEQRTEELSRELSRALSTQQRREDELMAEIAKMSEERAASDKTHMDLSERYAELDTRHSDVMAIMAERAHQIEAGQVALAEERTAAAAEQERLANSHKAEITKLLEERRHLTERLVQHESDLEEVRTKLIEEGVLSERYRLALVEAERVHEDAMVAHRSQLDRNQSELQEERRVAAAEINLQKERHFAQIQDMISQREDTDKRLIEARQSSEAHRRDAQEVGQLRKILVDMQVKVGGIAALEHALETARRHLVDAQDRIDTLSRSAEAREEMLQTSFQRERTDQLQKLAKQTFRADWLQGRTNRLAETLTVFAQRTMQGRDDAWLSLLRDDRFEPSPHAKDGADIMGWLSDVACEAMTSSDARAFEIDSAMRFTDMEFMAGIYQWLLGRQPDAPGLASYTDKLQKGYLRRELLLDVAQSMEARSRLGRVAPLRETDDRRFVEACYRDLHGRKADEEGLNHFLARLEGGKSRESVLTDFAFSEEARINKRPLISAIRAIITVNMPAFRRQSYVRRWLRPMVPDRKDVWLGGRIAALEAMATRSHEEGLQRLADFELRASKTLASAQRKIEQPAQLGRSHSGQTGAVAKTPVASFRDAALPFSSPAPNRNISLLDGSGDLTAKGIVMAIRSEIAERGLN